MDTLIRNYILKTINMEKLRFKSKHLLLFSAVMFLLSSCIDGYKDDWTFSTGVQNAQLESPEVEKYTFAKNAEGTVLSVSWGVVYGASGYQFQFVDITDPANPVVIMEETVEGCNIKCPIQEDSNYKVVVKALGNAKLNNKDALTATEAPYSTMLPATVIPNGTDLYQYFTENPIQTVEGEQAFELEAGGNYTLSGVVDFGSNWFTLRGNKANHPTITYTADGRMIVSSKGFNLKFVNIDCSAVPTTSGNASVLMLNPTPDESIKVGSYYVITNPVSIQGCKITGINARLFYDNDKAYNTSNLLIKNSIVNFNYINKGGGIYAYGGFIDNLTIANSTFYSTQDPEESSYFIRYRNGARGTASKVNILNSTFYNIMKSGQMANYSGLNNSSVTLTVSQNLFVNCGSQNVIRRLSAGGNNMVKVIKNNCYWFDGAFPEEGEINHNNGEKSAAPDIKAGNQWERGFGEDPAFANAAAGDFTIASGATNIIAKKVGDPRWLPIQ